MRRTSFFFLHINAPFLDIFGCARQYEQALLHSLARKFALRFSAALGNMSKLYCTRLHENWRRLGIIQVNLASALTLHKRSFPKVRNKQQKCYVLLKKAHYHSTKCNISIVFRNFGDQYALLIAKIVQGERNKTRFNCRTAAYLI